MFKFFKSTIKSAGKGVYHDPEFQKIVEKHPRFFHFMKKRLTPDEKFGLYLTVGVVITLIFVIFFFSIIQDLLYQDSLIQADLRIVNLVQIFRSDSFNNTMLFITNLGKGQIVFLGVVVLGIILVMHRRWRHSTALLASVSGGEIFVWMIKNLFERPRPALPNALLPEAGYSFPSGHAFVAISFYGLVSYFLYRELKNKFVKAVCLVSGLLIILAIGFSRIYLGAHWTSDVLASYVSGAAWLTTFITTLEIRRKFNPEEKKIPHYTKSKLVVLAFILISVWIGFMIFFFRAHPLKSPAMIPEKQVAISQNDIPSNLFSVFPRTSETIAGEEMEPINFIIVGSEQQVRQTFEKAGWFPTDPINPKTVWKLTLSLAFDSPYSTAPGVPSFWNTRPNDFGFEKPTDASSAKQRQHIHFWKTQFVLGDQSKVWLCTAHFDNKITFSSLIPVHTIDPAIDRERERVKDDIVKTGKVDSIEEFQIVEPTLNTNQGGDQFFTDGKAYIVYLEN